MWYHIKQGLFWNQGCDHEQNQVEKNYISNTFQLSKVSNILLLVIYVYAISQKVVCGII